MIRILVFGESITYGCWDSEGGWVDRLKREAFRQTLESEGKNKIQIINLGVGGDTSRKLLKRLSTEIEARQSDQWGLRLVLSFGVNDSRVTDGNTQIEVDEFRNNCHEILMKAKYYSKDIIVVGISPIEKSAVKFKQSEYIDAKVSDYDAILRQVAEELEIPYIDIRKVFQEQANQTELFCYDHLHLSDTGHALVAQTVQKDILTPARHKLHL